MATCKDCLHSFVCWKSMQVEKDNLPCSDFADRSLYVVREKGEWVTDKEDAYWGNSLKRKYCTRCKKRPPFDRETRKFILTDFCPNCGADMRKETVE